VLNTVPGILESAVVGLPDPDFGERVAAVIVPEPGADADVDALQIAASEQLARFKQPRSYTFLEALPRNTMGKVQKNLLRERLAVELG
jgi:malonyl-CoA/methylmalonyl-CoA synthetase